MGQRLAIVIQPAHRAVRSPKTALTSMSLIIAGERSGVGKTTVTLALLMALHRRGVVQSFKVGPDYIDPMFHRHVTGRDCRNLDPVLTSEAYVQQCFATHQTSADYALVEGVMGLFDGATGADDFASTAHIARLLSLPILLILNCASTSRSIAAIAHGYRTFDPRLNIAGVVLNRVASDRHLELLKAALAPLHLPILGVLRRQEEITIPDRHLGLVPTNELTQLQPILDRLAHLGETCFDWLNLLPLLQTNSRLLPNTVPDSIPSDVSPVRIAIAQDPAFNFYYADNLDLFRSLGATLLPWSPLTDRELPPGTQGLYFGGGFPEVFGAELSQNTGALAAVKAAIVRGMPTYAECGGLMYLCDRITDFAEQTYPMVGIFPTTAAMGKRLTLGYRQATVLRDTPLMTQGDRVWGHEFHRSTLTDAPEQPLYDLAGYDSQRLFSPEGWQRYQVHASYTHLHFGARPEYLIRFLQHCARFSAII
jgi:cobyrinic acid a,c-diamide synthase